MDFKCPSCESTIYVSKHSLGKKFNEGIYKSVLTEIQCANCFIDIPSNLSVNINNNEYEKYKKLWNEVYKPEHLKHAAKCSKCFRNYWEIEKYLFNKNISKKDIFYQIYNTKNGLGSLVCKICDPDSFK